MIRLRDSLLYDEILLLLNRDYSYNTDITLILPGIIKASPKKIIQVFRLKSTGKKCTQLFNKSQYHIYQQTLKSFL